MSDSDRRISGRKKSDSSQTPAIAPVRRSLAEAMKAATAGRSRREGPRSSSAQTDSTSKRQRGPDGTDADAIPTLVLMMSIGGSSGKSLLSNLLFEHFFNDIAGVRYSRAYSPLLIDADPLTAVLTREYLLGRLKLVKHCSPQRTTDLLTAPHIGGDYHFIPAADWPFLDDELSVFGRESNSRSGTDPEHLRRIAEEWDHWDRLRASVVHAQQCTSQMLGGHREQLHFLRNLVLLSTDRGTARSGSLAGRPRFVIVDLPAQAPSALIADDLWKTLFEAFLDAEWKGAGEPESTRRVRVVRVVISPEENVMGFHPVVRAMIDGGFDPRRGGVDYRPRNEPNDVPPSLAPFTIWERPQFREGHDPSADLKEGDTEQVAPRHRAPSLLSSHARRVVFVRNFSSRTRSKFASGSFHEIPVDPSGVTTPRGVIDCLTPTPHDPRYDRAAIRNALPTIMDHIHETPVAWLRDSISKV